MMRGRLTVAAVNLALLLVVLVAAELVFGDWLGRRGFGILNLPRETLHFDVSALYPGGGRIEYRRDRHGLRGPYPDPGCIDILTMGGSTTDQRALGEGETWQDRLRERFLADGRRVWVVNAGVDGQSTLGAIHDFDRWFPLIPGLRARYVLIYAGINDVYLHGAETNDRLEAPGPLLRLHHAVKNNSALYRLYRMAAGMLAARRANLTGEVVDYRKAVWADAPNLPPPADLDARAAAYGVRLKTLIGMIRTFGAEPILVTQRRGDVRRQDGLEVGLAAPPGLPNGLDEARNLDRFNSEMMRVCVASGAVCVDLAARVEFEPGEMYDRMHTTPAGALRIGDFLYERLKGLPVGGGCSR